MMQRSFKDQRPTLYIVSTPIGNLKDITYRAIEILNEVDVILTEDTRTSSVLLNHYQIKKPLLSYHEFNKDEKESHIINLLKESKHLALISDAGTPGINDPGYEIIKRAILEGFFVVAIPGASAILAALVTSGLLIQPFTFLGFLPKKASEIEKIISSYQYRKETLVIYESPHRILKTLTHLHTILGERKISIARELTKTFETIIRTTLKASLNMDHSDKGEYVLVIEGANEIVTFNHLPITDHVNLYKKQGKSDMEAIKMVAKERNIPKQEVYKHVKIK